MFLKKYKIKLDKVMKTIQLDEFITCVNSHLINNYKLVIRNKLWLLCLEIKLIHKSQWVIWSQVLKIIKTVIKNKK